MPSVCAKCVFLHATAKSDRWWAWLCTRHPLPQFFNPVTGETVADPPYQRCKKINDGECLDFEAGPNILFPKEQTK